ncbi:MAG: amidohydrolase family protein [Proteobacteria bacterium]|nr:amidohydrolase family protein [Pseudomonadota bacterium]
MRLSRVIGRAVRVSMCLAATAASSQASTTYDLWIRNGTVVDGTGRPRFAADILVSGDTIAYVGSTAGRNVKARRTIDAAGKIVTPGFIDLHAHGDPSKQAFTNFLQEGITTVLLGQDGNTASYEDEDPPTLAQWKAARAAGLALTDDQKPVTLAQWLHHSKVEHSLVNVAALSGHGSLRTTAGVGDAPQPTAKQLAAMKEILRADLDAGAFGMSFGLEYAPGRFALEPEEKALGAIVGEYGGVVMSHMRSEDFDKIAGAIDELLQIDAHVHVSHIKIVAGKRPEEAQAVLDQLARARAGGKTVTADVYSYPASASNLVFLYPEWARSESQYADAVKHRRAELEAHLRKRVEERNGPQAILFVSGPYAGKRLSELAQQLGKPYEKVLIDDFDYGGPEQAHFLMSEAVQSVFIAADNIGYSTDASPELKHPRATSSFAKVLEDYVGPAPKMSLEKTIHKMSGLAADIVGIKDRGVLAVDRKADIVVLSPNRLHVRATWAAPMQSPTGFDAVVVNGAIELENGKVGTPNGRILRREGHPVAHNASSK